jgi:hypothetical protein
MPKSSPKVPEQDVERKNQPPASIESNKDESERRRVGPEDEDRRLHKGEKRPFGQMP